MENKIIDQPNSFEKIAQIIKRKKKYFIIIFVIILVIISGFFLFNYYQNQKNEKISEKYVLAGIFLTKDNKKRSTEIYKEIIYSKNKFYSFLALSNIIENNLEENSDEILNLFEIVENINYEKEQKNFIKLKKSLYLMKILKKEEAKKLLEEIISDNSIWEETALSIFK